MKAVSMSVASGEDLEAMNKALEWVKQNRSSRHTPLEFERRVNVVGQKESIEDLPRYQANLVRAGHASLSRRMFVQIQIQAGKSYWRYDLYVEGDTVEFHSEWKQ